MVHFVFVPQSEESKLAKRRHLFLRQVQKYGKRVTFVNDGGFAEGELLDTGILIAWTAAGLPVGENNMRNNLPGNEASIAPEIHFKNSFAADVKPEQFESKAERHQFPFMFCVEEVDSAELLGGGREKRLHGRMSL